MAFIFGLIDQSYDPYLQEATPREGEQVAVERSPDQAYTARVLLPELDGMGATISQPYQVWIENKRNETRWVLKASRTAEIRIKWLSARELEICYNDAQIARFRSRYIDIDRSASGEIRDQTVEVTLRHVKQLDECP